MDQDARTIDAVFAERLPGVRVIYDRLIAALRPIGTVGEEPKKASIHLMAGDGPSFAGVHPQKMKLLLNIRTDNAIPSPRIRKIEQVSKSRFHNEVLLADAGDIDEELVSWLGRAYDLAAGRGPG